MKNFATILLLLLWVHSQVYSGWASFGGNASRTGYTAEKVGLPDSHPKWVQKLGGQIISSPSVFKGAVYIGSRDSSFYAIDTESGKILWKYKTGQWVDSSPFISRGKVTVGSRDKYIYVFDSETGQVLNKIGAGLQLSSPLVTDKGIIISGIGPPTSRISVYNPNEIGNEWAKYFLQPTYSSPAIQGDRAIVGSNDGVIYAVDYKLNKSLWKFRTRGGIYLSSPAIENGVVYIAPGDTDPEIYALYVATGNPRWIAQGRKVALAKRTATARKLNTMLLLKLRKMLPEQRSTIFAKLNGRQNNSFNKSRRKNFSKLQSIKNKGLKQTKGLFKKTSSTAVNRKSINSQGNIIYLGSGIKTSSVAVGKENVFVIQREMGYINDLDLSPISTYTLLAIDKKSGLTNWSFSENVNGPQLGYNSSPAIANDKIFFGWGEGKIYALDTKTGDVLWQDQLDGHIISSPAIANRSMFVATTTGSLYNFSLTQTAVGETFKKDTYAYPNPATGAVSNIQVYVEKEGTASIVLYNVAQRPVFKVSQKMAGGNPPWTHLWKLNNVANGVYFAKVIVRYKDGGKDTKIIKVAILR